MVTMQLPTFYLICTWAVVHCTEGRGGGGSTVHFIPAQKKTEKRQRQKGQKGQEGQKGQKKIKGTKKTNETNRQGQNGQ